ncbi:MAG: 4-hydroxy-tetrahydrodipicolinate synthase [Clostridia bacterium]|nr:4-hydroxy-tetrahydrodipicolinate synthase [Clostridia bacterium]
MSLFNGCGVALVTPFDKEGNVSFEALDSLLSHVINGGVDALFVCGTTGEPSTMTKQERESVISHCIRFAKGKIPVFAGSGGNNTAEAVAFSRRCEELGADGLLVVTPYYNKCTQNGAYLHYKEISDAVHIPVIAYNVPTRTGFNLKPETIARLCELKNVRGVKEASGDIDQMLEVARLTHGKMDFYIGDDSLTVPAMSVGAKGVISVAANVVPDKMSKLTALCAQGDYAQAAELSFTLSPFIKKLFCEVNPIPCKKALEFLGIAAGVPRLPLTEAEPAHAREIRDELIALGLIRA